MFLSCKVLHKLYADTGHKGLMPGVTNQLLGGVLRESPRLLPLLSLRVRLAVKPVIYRRSLLTGRGSSFRYVTLFLLRDSVLKIKQSHVAAT